MMKTSERPLTADDYRNAFVGNVAEYIAFVSDDPGFAATAIPDAWQETRHEVGLGIGLGDGHFRDAILATVAGFLGLDLSPGLRHVAAAHRDGEDIRTIYDDLVRR